jgi:hypothetical protein
MPKHHSTLMTGYHLVATDGQLRKPIRDNNITHFWQMSADLELQAREGLLSRCDSCRYPLIYFVPAERFPVLRAF